MKTIDKDLILLSDLIYTIYSSKKMEEFQIDFLQGLNSLVPFGAGSFYLKSNDPANLIGHEVAINIPPAILEQYREFGEAIDNVRWSFGRTKSIVFRETDLFNEGEREKTEYFKLFYLSNNWFYSLNVILANETGFLGVITLYRDKEDEDFKQNEIMILDLLKDHLALQLSIVQKTIDPIFSKYRASREMENLLTQREVEVLRLIVQGENNHDIAECLVISPNTVKKHTQSIYRKLGVENRLGLLKRLRNPL